MRFAALDEADVMLKMGFKEDVDEILRSVKQVKDPADYQGLICSATIPSWVKATANEFLKRGFGTVDLANDLKNKTSRTVNHLSIFCPYHNRITALADILICYGGG